MNAFTTERTTECTTECTTESTTERAVERTAAHAVMSAAHAPPPFGRIALAIGRGTGPTPLAAFDDALLDAGVANYNLICLSSVIPPGSVIERRKWVTPREHWGRRLYCVLSQMREDRPGRTAHAGIGWVRDEASGAGLFVELHDESREPLERDLRSTLRAMQAGRGLDFGEPHTEVAGITCTALPVCALVIAVYAAAPW